MRAPSASSRRSSSGFDRAGHDVTLAVGRRPETPDHLEQLIPAGVSVVHLPWQRRTLRAQPPAARALRSVVADLRPDVVHLHSSIAGAVGMIVRGRGVTLYTPHGYSFSSGSPNSGRMVVQRMVERMVAQRCDMVVAVSEAEGRLARDVIRARRVRVIPNGIPELDDPAGCRTADGSAARRRGRSDRGGPITGGDGPDPRRGVRRRRRHLDRASAARRGRTAALPRRSDHGVVGPRRGRRPARPGQRDGALVGGRRRIAGGAGGDGCRDRRRRLGHPGQP